jgi:hypothetical protein
MYNKKLNEGIKYKEMEGLVKPTLHIDKFESKMGSEDEICVLSFYVRNNSATTDLISWFEKGYDFILDADRSPGEVKPNRYLVYVELKRRTNVPDHIEELLTDLGSITEFENLEDWQVTYQDRTFVFNKEQIQKEMILSPKEYRDIHEEELNEMRQQAGIPTKRIYENDAEMKAYKSLAGL